MSGIKRLAKCLHILPKCPANLRLKCKMSFTSLNLNNCEANLHTKINETDTGAVETSMYPTDHSKKKKNNKKTKRCTQGRFGNRYIASNTNINTRALNTDPWSCSSRSTGQVPWRSPGNDQTAASALFHSETVGNLWGCCPCPCSGDPIRTRWVSACRLWACMNLGWSWKAQTRHS